MVSVNTVMGLLLRVCQPVYMYVTSAAISNTTIAMYSLQVETTSLLHNGDMTTVTFD